MEDFWLSFISSLEKELPHQQISAWIKPLIPVAFDDSKSILRISAPNRFKLDLVKKKFASQIEILASEWFKKSVNVIFELPVNSERIIHKKPDLLKSFVGNYTYNNKIDYSNNHATPKIEISLSSEVANVAYERSRLNTVLTFDSFVTGKANQLARAASLQVSENPGVSYNPLFLYGGVGLGKTHLIHAVGNSMLCASNDVKVRYVHADQYVSDVVKAYQRKAFDEFKKYYHSLDLLLIDDIQFFSGKNRTQEEFFYAFEAMVAQHKQIIITSDTYPKELSGIDSRLISRFDSGLTVAIEPPELEMRVAILLRKAESENLPMPEEVAFFIAKHLRSNVRELEGALRKVLAYVRFHGRNVLTVDVCKEALKDLLSVSNGQITVENIQKTVADYYKIKIADMYSKRRPANIALPRQIAMYLSKELTQKSLPEIGDLFGGRDHTTVLHAVRKISDARIKQADLNHNLHVLEQTLKG
ncbi:chromosomal replication initiator protein dnaA [Candidatus Kinetoplastibacterium oncopeltii TCC290E]|uniref:Chromosomal replication initiator protein DnaA n=1 Tax=Candidatus Kinetoplastidibacterium stringomonadis TCC290E TaxID=1208920 RepID=M1L5Y0_9PROT|nr:chromosomal replication initiator protein DnaA [Candidatus Kinetoplastibacterium oncopeltii]AGF48033.1 chromosomal replication initiator protein dnaA [Candidatus Kinetoplastibacterium oncopeltii TCC290E]